MTLASQRRAARRAVEAAMEDRRVRHDINPLWFLGAAIRSAARFPPGALGFALRVTVNQIRFTAVRALPLLVLVSILIAVPILLSPAAIEKHAATPLATSSVRRKVSVLRVPDVGPSAPNQDA